METNVNFVLISLLFTLGPLYFERVSNGWNGS